MEIDEGAGIVKIDIQGNQSKKIQLLKKQGGRLLQCSVRIEMRDGRIAAVDDWGRVTWEEIKNKTPGPLAQSGDEEK